MMLNPIFMPRGYHHCKTHTSPMSLIAVLYKADWNLSLVAKASRLNIAASSITEHNSLL